MPALARGQTSDCSTPILDLYTHVGGVLTDVYSAEFQIFDMSSATPAQVYPEDVDTRATVNLDDCPSGDRLGLGHYVARWTPSDDEDEPEPVGRHELRWFVKVESDSAEVAFTERFEVLATPVALDGYCSIQDLRDEGVTTSQADDARLGSLITRATLFIERITKRSFLPRVRSYTLDGTSSPVLRLGMPIIAIESVTMNDDAVDLDTVKVYNRHLSQGLIHPDDRNDPRIEKNLQTIVFGLERDATATLWKKGKQNIRVTGVFGYTDPTNGADITEGVTPDLIRYACMRLVVRALPKLTSSSLTDVETSGIVTQLRTRDQTIVYGSDTRFRGITTDAEIDQILMMFSAPTFVGVPGVPSP